MWFPYFNCHYRSMNSVRVNELFDLKQKIIFTRAPIEAPGLLEVAFENVESKICSLQHCCFFISCHNVSNAVSDFQKFINLSPSIPLFFHEFSSFHTEVQFAEIRINSTSILNFWYSSVRKERNLYLWINTGTLLILA